MQFVGVLFTTDGRGEWVTDRWIGAAPAVMSVAVKRERGVKAKLPIVWMIYVPTLTYEGTSSGNERSPKGGWPLS